MSPNDDGSEIEACLAVRFAGHRHLDAKAGEASGNLLNADAVVLGDLGAADAGVGALDKSDIVWQLGAT